MPTDPPKLPSAGVLAAVPLHEGPGSLLPSSLRCVQEDYVQESCSEGLVYMKAPHLYLQAMRL